MIDIMKLGLGQARPNKNTSKTREEVLESSAADNAPPKVRTRTQFSMRKGSGTFFIEWFLISNIKELVV